MYVQFNMQLHDSNSILSSTYKNLPVCIFFFWLYPMIISHSLNMLEMLQFFAERL